MVKKELFSPDSCACSQQDLDLSNKQMKVLMQGIRGESGSWKVIEKNAYQKVVEKNHRLDEYVEIHKLVYQFKDKEKRFLTM